jgi:antitoxin component YwqK of YwqJK toxin-antitoxin module
MVCLYNFIKNGNLSCEGTYKNGKRHGFMRSFHPDDKLLCQFTMINGDTICDDYEEYDEDGNPSTKMYDTGIDHKYMNQQKTKKENKCSAYLLI